jgi:hypothetical protein
LSACVSWRVWQGKYSYCKISPNWRLIINNNNNKKNLRFDLWIGLNTKKNCNLHPISNLKADSESSENSTYFVRKKNNLNVKKSWNIILVHFQRKFKFKQF